MPIIISGSKGTTILSGSSTSGSMEITGSLTVSGSSTLTNYGTFISNEGGAAHDFRVETIDETHMLFIDGSSNRASIGDSTDAPAATLEITNANDGGVPLLQLNSNDTDKTAIDVNAANINAAVIDVTADAVQDAAVIQLSADALTTGTALNIDDNSSSTSTRSTVWILQNHASATGATALTVKSDGGNTGVTLDKNASGDAGQNATGLHIDFDRTVASSGTNAHNDIGVDLDVNSRSLGTSTVVGLDVDVTGHTDGTHTATGMELTTTGADTNKGLIINCADGGDDLVIQSSADADDLFKIQVGAAGATTFTTVDDAAAAADLTFTLDGAFDVNANQEVAIDSTAASITVGAALADGQTLKLGKNGAVETIIAPHGTAGSELYSVTNTAGTATNAINLTSTAGGIRLNTSKGTFSTGSILTSGSVYVSDGGKFGLLDYSGGHGSHIQFVNSYWTEIQTRDDTGFSNDHPQIVLQGLGQNTIVMNSKGGDCDFLVYGDSNSNLIRTDAANDLVGIGKSPSATILDVGGNVSITGSLNVSGSGIVLTAAEAGNAVLTLNADQGDDAADITTFTHAAGGNLTVACGTDIILDPASGEVAIDGDLTVSGGDITYANSANATLSVTATTHDTVGRNLNITAGPTTAGTTNNIGGGALVLQAGRGKGSAAGGDLILQTAQPGASGNSINSNAHHLFLSGSGGSGHDASQARSTFDSTLDFRRGTQFITGDATLTNHDSGKLILLQGSTLTVTLPDSGHAYNTGCWFTFYSVSGSPHKIVCADPSNEEIYGWVKMLDTDTANTYSVVTASGGTFAVSSVNFNGTTSGMAGSVFTIVATNDDTWQITHGDVIHTGTANGTSGEYIFQEA